MRILRRLLIGVATLAVTGSGIARAASGAPAQKPFSLTLSGPQEAVKVGQPVPMKITLTNISGRELLIIGSRHPRGAEDDFQLCVRDAQGNLAAMKPREPSQGSQAGGSWAPGQSFTDKFDLGESFDLTKPGKYTVQLKRKDVKTGVEVESNTVTVTVAK